MRIIGGQWKGRAIEHPHLRDVRPTRDFVKTQIFNVLDHRYHIDWTNTRVLDYCAGSGQMGLEALSRGAQHVTFVDKNPACIKGIRGNLERFGAEQERYRLTTCHSCESGNPGGPHDFLGSRFRGNDTTHDIAFLDPPYHDLALYQSILSTLQSKLVIVEMEKKYDLPSGIPYVCDLEKKSGTSRVFYLSKIT